MAITKLADLTPDPSNANRNQSRVTYIYTLLDDEGRVRYIGKSHSPLVRLRGHIHRAIRLNHPDHKSTWIRSMIQRGIRPTLYVLECCSVDAWQRRETMWIAFLKKQFDITNHLAGGDGAPDPDERTRAKMRAAKVGRVPWNKGKKTPPDVRQKQSQAAKRRSPAARANIKAAAITRAKAAASLSPDEIREIRRLCEKTDLSLSEIGRRYGKCHPIIKKIKQRTAYAWVK